ADSFLHYTHNFNDANGASIGGITSIHDDRNGNLWMIMSDIENKGKYINLFDTKKHQFKQFGILEKGNQYISASVITNSFEDNKGRTWIGTNNGIYEYTPASDKFIPHLASADSSQQKRFHHLTEDAAHPGIIWMTVLDVKSGKREGLLQYNIADNTVKAYRHVAKNSTSLGNDAVYTIRNDSKGHLWFGTADGLSVFEVSSERFINYSLKDKKTGPDGNFIQEIKEDKAGDFWSYDQNGLLFFDTKTKTFIRYAPPEKDPDAVPKYINSLLIDRSGMLWVGTDFQGVYWLNRNHAKYTVYKNDPALPHYFPGGGHTSFAEEKDGTFWVWSSHGLYHWYPSSDSFTFIKPMNDQGEDFAFHFSSVIIDRKGIVWCNSFGKGLFSYDPQTKAIRNFRNNEKDPTSLINDYVNTLYLDDKATLWIGTFGGLCSLNPGTGTFKQYPYVINYNKNTPDSALNDNGVYAIYKDKQGEFWIGTNLGGVNRFNLESATFTSFQNQLPGFATVTYIFEDSKKHLWAGTHVGGLFLCDRKTNTVKKFTEEDGLLYDGVLAINEDNKNNLWITSARGISILNTQTNKIFHLGITNGLPELPENNANFFKTSHGHFLMPCNNGFIFFDPEQLKPDTALPLIHIESIEIKRIQSGRNKQTDSIIYGYGKNKINLHYNENRITFNYVGLQYQNSSFNQYAYQLEGYDKDWIQAGPLRKITYTNLSPGEYIFHLKGANSDGVWNTLEQMFTVIISPPWWFSWWAYLLYAIVFAASVWALIAYRSRSLNRKNKILEEKVEHRTEQLTQSLENLKATQTQLIQSEKMASLGELTAGIAHEIQNPLNFVNNFSDVNKELADELEQEIDKGNYNDAKALAKDIRENEEKINHHGKRADAIVKGMLQHSRTSSGQREPTDINALADEYLRLAYHGLRAKDKSFNATMKTDFDESIGKVNVIPQDIGRVILNLINNAFYAVDEKKKQ
ncbi:MAG TPA: two-component regulator propeller domain-containing protein, partial [Chitinophagaceae bacterium]|nr:two-component regulator propeller domain-containing protein [Chitinophagaceae bacterium]